jgi:two-component system, sensor histidine kinase PdtaS
MAVVGNQTSTPDQPERDDEPAALRRALAEQQRIEAELRAAIAAQDQAFRKLSHRLKNNLQLVISIVSLRLSALRDPESRRELEDLLSKIHALALIQKKLHDGGGLLAVEFDGFLRELTAVLERPQAARRIALELEPVTIGIERAVPLGLIANELIGMAAQSSPDEPLAITLAHQAGKVVLAIGPIAPAALEAPGRPDLGMPLVRALARQAQADLTIDGPPATVRLSFDPDPPG